MRYYFHLHDEDGVTLDEVGQRFAELEEAKRAAANALYRLALHDLDWRNRISVRRIDITDESGRYLASVHR